MSAVLHNTFFVVIEKSVKMNNVSAMEINEVRPFFSRAMGTLIQLRPDTVNGGNEGEEGAGIYA